MIGVILGVGKVELDNTFFPEGQFVVGEVAEEPWIFAGRMCVLKQFLAKRFKFWIEWVEHWVLSGSGMPFFTIVTVVGGNIPS